MAKYITFIIISFILLKAVGFILLKAVGFTTCFISLIVFSKFSRFRNVMVSKVVYQSIYRGFTARRAHFLSHIFCLFYFFPHNFLFNFFVIIITVRIQHSTFYPL